MYSPPSMEPADIVVGLGAADRNLLCVCLALFEDSTLARRLAELYSKTKKRLNDAVDQKQTEQAVASIQSRITHWRDSPLTDEDLRLALWIYLREAFALAPKLAVSDRTARSAADDLVAAIIHHVDPPPGLISAVTDRAREILGRSASRRHRAAFSDVALPVIDDLLATAFTAGAGELPEADRDRLLADIRKSLQEMDDASRRRLLDAVGADELNDAAILKMILLGGGLTSIGVSVGLSGFAAYILAAKASALIPLVSGPMLVSILAILADPLTIVVGGGLGGWLFSRAANARVRAEVAVRVASLLALQALSDGHRSVQGALRGFARAEQLAAHGDLDAKSIQRYAAEWRRILPAQIETSAQLNASVEQLMRRSLSDDIRQGGRLRRLLFPGEGATLDTAAVAVMTVGDILYCAAAIDPTVIAAADFSRAAEIDGPVEFAVFAHNVKQLDPAGYAGAESNLSGYVAEQVVAAQLVAQGHQVSFPETSNQQGWDLMVDGHPFQVKCYEDASSLGQHFAVNPDIPVLANAELAGKVSGEYADRVYFVEGYSHATVREVTDSSLDAGADMFSPDVPVFALAVSAVRNLIGVQRGRVTGAQAVEQVLIDGSMRMGLAAIGGYAGTAIGLLVFGPAGALVFSAAMPVLSQAQSSRLTGVIDEQLTSPKYNAWAANTDNALAKLIAAVSGATKAKQRLLSQKRAQLPSGAVGDYLRARFDDDSAALKEAAIDLDHAVARKGTVEQRVAAVVQWTARCYVHPIAFQHELMALAALMNGRPAVIDRIDEHFDKAIESGKSVVEDARRRLFEWVARKTK